LRKFDFKDVIYDRKTQEMFLEEVREAIITKDKITPLKKREIWLAIKESKFPIIMGIMAAADGSIDFACNAANYAMVNVFRTGFMGKMTQEGIIRGTDIVR